MINKTLFYSKILLFGEYGIIKNSMGLSIPYSSYKGQLQFSNKKTSSNDLIAKYVEYLKIQYNKNKLSEKIDFESLKKDIKKGLIFQSNIPQGFGIGSSGALVAAIYDKYAINKITIEDSKNSKNQIFKLKKIFSQMENYFHGTSSGIDPLICYLNIPILINSKENIESIGLPKSNNGNRAIFLINSGIPGSTSTMIEIFMEKMKHKGFRNMLKSEFKKYNDACIKSFLKGEFSPLFKNIKKLSHLILEKFAPMIPNSFVSLWKQGIDTNSYYLKLCGSGGGGFVLGFTENLQQTKKILKEQELEIIYRF